MSELVSLGIVLGSGLALGMGFLWMFRLSGMISDEEWRAFWGKKRGEL